MTRFVAFICIITIIIAACGQEPPDPTPTPIPTFIDKFCELLGQAADIGLQPTEKKAFLDSFRHGYQQTSGIVLRDDEIRRELHFICGSDFGL